jgi:hypothetical protein
MITALVYDSGVGSGNLTPLEELRSLDQQIDQISTLAGLQPLFARLEDITKIYSGDFEVQLVAHDVKQHMLTHGSRIKQLQPPAPVVAPPPAAPTPMVAPTPIAAPAPLAAAPPRVTKAPPALKNQPTSGKPRSKKLLWVFAGLLLTAGIAVTAKMLQDRNLKLAQTTPVDARITTVPPGAEVQINGQPTCKSDCVTKLAPGKYPVTATLEGYEPATGELTIAPSKPASLDLTLVPQPVSVRIFADLGTGNVFLDDQQAGELLDGQFTLDRLEPGLHHIRVAGGKSEATFSITTAPLAVPVMEGPIETKELLAVLVASMGDRARLASSSGPLKLSLNGQQEADASPGGIDLNSFKAGPSEFVIGEGTTKRTLTGSFGTAPTLTAFLKSDQKIGTLIISTGTDGARIFLNGKEQKRRTEKGQARLQTFGDVTVRVEKPGFEPVPAQSANVGAGSEARLSFNMKALPQFAALSISGAVPGTQVLLSDRPLGTVGTDGSYRNGSISPGDHAIELRRDQFEPKRFTRNFRVGETVAIGASDATLAAVRPPPVAEPPPPPKVEAPPPKPAPKVRASGTITGFDNPGAWAQSDGVWRHRGAATLTYGLQPDGIFTFSIYMLKGGRVRWVLDYVDAKNYALFELDEKTFWVKSVENGKTIERSKVAHKQDKSMRVWNIQIDASATRIIHRIQGDDNWVDLDTWSDPNRDFTKGKFGILVSGSDEVGLSNFTFTGR